MKPVSGWISNQHSYSNEEPGISVGPNHCSFCEAETLLLLSEQATLQHQAATPNAACAPWAMVQLHLSTENRRQECHRSENTGIATASSIWKSGFSQVLSNTSTGQTWFLDCFWASTTKNIKKIGTLNTVICSRAESLSLILSHSVMLLNRRFCSSSWNLSRENWSCNVGALPPLLPAPQ